MNYWLVKSEPNAYSWDQFVKEGKTFWSGVRNYQARNNMKSMSLGDHVFFYHSNVGLEIVGIATVVGEHYQDPTSDDDRWVVVDLSPLKPLNQPVSLSIIKKDPRLNNIALVKFGRLSVVPITEEEYSVIMELAKTK